MGIEGTSSTEGTNYIGAESEGTGCIPNTVGFSLLAITTSYQPRLELASKS